MLCEKSMVVDGCELVAVDDAHMYGLCDSPPNRYAEWSAAFHTRLCLYLCTGVESIVCDPKVTKPQLEFRSSNTQLSPLQTQPGEQ